MQLFSTYYPISEKDNLLLRGEKIPVGVCIGNFDGMHLGHQAIFSKLLDYKSKLYKILITLYPHPKLVLGDKKSANAINFLTPLRNKIALAKRIGFDGVFIIKFTKKLSELEPEEFIEEYLSRLIKPSLVVVGKDWCFGKDKKGRASTLVELSSKYNFKSIVIDDVCSNNSERISSTKIREYILKGELDAARNLLGRRYALYEKVIPGTGRGRLIGFHTANLKLHSPLLSNVILPPNGVYAMKASIEGDSKTYHAVCNIGMRPTFGENKKEVEVHLINYTGQDFYGKRVHAEFYSFIREEMKFSNVEALTSQIKQDITFAEKLLKSGL